MRNNLKHFTCINSFNLTITQSVIRPITDDKTETQRVFLPEVTQLECDKAKIQTQVVQHI